MFRTISCRTCGWSGLRLHGGPRATTSGSLNYDYRSVRGITHEAVVGLKVEAHKGDEFELIRKKTREYLDRPKKKRAPFIKNLFVKRIDPTALEYPQLDFEQLTELHGQVEPVIKLMRSDVDPKDIDAEEAIPEKLQAELGSAGGYVYTIPRTHDGNDMGMTGYTRMVESLSLNGNVTVGALAYHRGSWATKVILKHGSEEQKNFYLPRIANGTAAFSLCVAEAESGSDVASMKCGVRLGPDNRGYIVDGKKSWVVNAPNADYFVVVAKHVGLGIDADVSPDNLLKQFETAQSKQGSLSTFVISKKAPGVQVTETVDFSGLRGLQVAEVVFDNVAISLDSLIGGTGQGFPIAMDAVAAERHILAAAALPLLRKLIDNAAQYAINRKLFGRYLHEFEMIQEKLVECTFLTYTLESMVYLTSLFNDTTINPEFDLEAAAVRVFMGDVLTKCIENCMRIHGAAGVQMDTDLELAMRDAITLCHMDGGTDIARLYVSLTGLQFAGMQATDDIHKLNNPLNYPWDKMKHFIGQNFRSQRSARKRTVFLEDYVHPTLQTAAQDLEDRCNQTHAMINHLLYTYHKLMINRQIDLRRLADAVILIYGCFAALGRASRSYCIGIKNNELEINLAQQYCLYADQRIQQIFNQIENDSFGGDSAIQAAMKFIVVNKGYCLEHPLTRNW